MVSLWNCLSKVCCTSPKSCCPWVPMGSLWGPHGTASAECAAPAPRVVALGSPWGPYGVPLELLQLSVLHQPQKLSLGPYGVPMEFSQQSVLHQPQKLLPLGPYGVSLQSLWYCLSSVPRPLTYVWGRSRYDCILSYNYTLLSPSHYQMIIPFRCLCIAWCSWAVVPTPPRLRSILLLWGRAHQLFFPHVLSYLCLLRLLLL